MRLGWWRLGGVGHLISHRGQPAAYPVCRGENNVDTPYPPKLPYPLGIRIDGEFVVGQDRQPLLLGYGSCARVVGSKIEIRRTDIGGTGSVDLKHPYKYYGVYRLLSTADAGDFRPFQSTYSWLVERVSDPNADGPSHPDPRLIHYSKTERLIRVCRTPLSVDEDVSRFNYTLSYRHGDKGFTHYLFPGNCIDLDASLGSNIPALSPSPWEFGTVSGIIAIGGSND